MNEYPEIIKWHPQLILISEKPVTWYGLFNVNNDTQMTIKLKVPYYPKLKRAVILFGEKISLTYGTDFSAKVSMLLKSANSVMSFLMQLQKLLDNILKQQANEWKVKIDWRDHFILDELKSVLTISDVTISTGDSLNLIKITYKNISIILKHNDSGASQWTVVSSELPKLQSWPSLESCTSSLTEIIETIQSRVDTLEDTWENLHHIDENCWVLDPLDPKPCHLHRRIFLKSALSLLITLDPLNLDNLQEIKVLGSENEVATCSELINNNIHRWTTDKRVIDNLLDLLDLSELPRPVKSKKSPESDGIFDDKECCICFANEGENGEIPSVVCNNEKCQKYFHNSCLLQWLQVLAESSLFFNRINGSCPNCKTNISCPLISA